MSTPAAFQEREAGPMQIVILLGTVCLAVLVTAILGPTLPKMEAHFASVENVESLVPLAMTAPMLIMAIMGLAAGFLIDRFGRKWTLVIAAALYGVIGTSPLYLESLHAILASRILLGFVEIVVSITGIALIGDLFTGQKRARLIALQTTLGTLAAFALNNLGGVLGELGWRAPYAFYSIGFVLAIMAAIFLWEPDRQSHAPEKATLSGDAAALGTGKLDRPIFALHLVLVLLAGLIFLTVPVNFAFLFEEIGVVSTSAIGIAYGVNSLGAVAGSLVFGWVLSKRLGVNGQLAVAFGFMGAGFLGLWASQTYFTLMFSGVFAGFGGGVLFPTITTWNLRMTPVHLRGLGLGAFQSVLFFGQFLAGIAVVWAGSFLGGRAEAIKWLGIALVVATAISLFTSGMRRVR